MKFAQRAKTIKNKVVLNEEKSVGELNAIIAALKKEVEGLQAYSVALVSMKSIIKGVFRTEFGRFLTQEKAFTELGGDASTVKVEKSACCWLDLAWLSSLRARCLKPCLLHLPTAYLPPAM